MVFRIVGADNNVTLSKYGHCNFISSKHACIFFDEVYAFDLLSIIGFLNVFGFFKITCRKRSFAPEKI